MLSLLLLPGLVAAQEPSAGSRVYKQVVPSVAYIRTARASGSGTLVDKARRLVLTNYHVIDGAERPGAGAGYDPVDVYFPRFKDGGIVADKAAYKSGGFKGEVVAVNRKWDLAVVRLSEVPAPIPEVKLAERSPGPGDPVHSIGNAGASGALWGYVKGSVRNVYQKQWQAKAGNKTLRFNARVIEADSPTNPGDSGGPLLNDAGELVGVTQGGATTANAVSYFVDLSEVRKLLTSRELVDKVGPRTGGGQMAKEPAKADPAKPGRRAEPLQVRDDADLFSAAAVEAADKAVAELHKGGLDVLIETYPTPPAAWKDKAADPKQRAGLYLDWAIDRLKAEQSDGIALLITTDPRYFRLAGGNDWLKRLPKEFDKRVSDALRADLRQNPDKALAEVLAVIKDAHAAATKK
jgi:S1-C subfamily serine protease